MKVQRTSVGLDVHARSVVACGLDGDTGEVFERRLGPEHGEILSWLAVLPGPVAVTYEAEAEDKTSETIIQKIFDELPVP